MVAEQFPQPDVKLDYFQGTSGTYAGFDRFGRIKDQKWIKSETVKDRHQYGYDYNSNRLWRQNSLTHGTANKFGFGDRYLNYCFGFLFARFLGFRFGFGPRLRGCRIRARDDSKVLINPSPPHGRPVRVCRRIAAVSASFSSRR